MNIYISIYIFPWNKFFPMDYIYIYIYIYIYNPWKIVCDPGFHGVELKNENAKKYRQKKRWDFVYVWL